MSCDSQQNSWLRFWCIFNWIAISVKSKWLSSNRHHFEGIYFGNWFWNCLFCGTLFLLKLLFFIRLFSDQQLNLCIRKGFWVTLSTERIQCCPIQIIMTILIDWKSKSNLHCWPFSCGLLHWKLALILFIGLSYHQFRNEFVR